MKSAKNKSGALMLGLMVMILIISIVAIRMLPEAETVERRNKEENFALTISLIRQAVTLERFLGDSSPCKAEYDSLILDPDDPAKIEAYLNALLAHNFLTIEDYRSPVVAPHLWGTAVNQIFWQAKRNLMASDTSYGVGSFEAGTEMNEGFSSPIGWVNSMTDNDSATFSTSVPLGSYDDFTWQNKFGSIGGGSGQSLRIASSTP